jgi:endo-1,4-beta-mannosidase
VKPNVSEATLIAYDLPLVVGPAIGTSAVHTLRAMNGKLREVRYQHAVAVGDEVYFAISRKAGTAFARLRAGKYLGGPRKVCK